MIGQELKLEKDQQRDGADDEADLGDQPQHEAHDASAYLARSGQKLHKDVARQLAAQAPSHVFVGDLLSQLSVEVADLSREQDEMQQHVGMHDKENERAEPEEAEERQVHIEERQLDGALQEKIAMGDAANSDEKVEQHKEIAEPQSPADTGGINHGVAQRLEILCRASEGHCRRRKWRRLVGGGSCVTCGGVWRCRWSRVLRLVRHARPPSGSLWRESGNAKTFT